MRIRTRQTIHPGLPARTVSSYETPIPPGTGLNSFFDGGMASGGLLEESIEDSTESKNTTKEVLHTKSEWQVLPLLCGLEIFDDSHYQRVFTPGVSVYSLTGRNLGDVISQVDFDLNGFTKTEVQLVAEAKHKFYSENQVNNLLTAIEFGDLISTLKDIKEIMSSVLFRRRLPKIRKLSSLYLGYNFGIAPLVSDLKKMHKMLPLMRKRLRRTFDRATSSYVVFARDKASFDVVFPGGYTGYIGEESPTGSYASGTYWYGRPKSGRPPTRICGVRGHNNYKYESEVFSTADQLISSLITTGPASLAWELVPYSFVADWFVDSSNVFDRLDNLLMGNRKSIDDIWLTTSYDIELPCILYKVSPTHRTDLDGQQIGHVSRLFYHRKPIADDLTITSSGRFGKKQVALSAALLHQLVAKR